MVNKIFTKEELELREKEDKRRNKRYYITLPIVAILAFIFLMAFWSAMDESKMSIHCSISDIEYRDVRPYKCWDSNDYNTSRYCPLPRNIDCKGDIENLGTIVGSMISEMFS